MKKNPIATGAPLAEGESTVEIVDKATMYHNFVKVEKYNIRTRKFNGSWSPVYERHILSTGGSGNAAAGLLYDPARDVVVLIEQFRLPYYLHNLNNGWCLELVAGLIEVGGNPEETIIRESVEESGCAVLRVEKIAEFMGSAGAFSEMQHIFVCAIHAPEESAVHGLEHEDENIRTHILSADDAIKLCDDGHIEDAKTLFALNWLARHRDALRQRWLSSPLEA